MEQGAHFVPVAVERDGTLFQKHPIVFVLFGRIVLLAASVVRALAAPDAGEGQLIRGLRPFAPFALPWGFSRGNPSTYR